MASLTRPGADGSFVLIVCMLIHRRGTFLHDSSFEASIGREGPTVQIGASIMHSLRRFTRFSVADIDRGLILAGGAAGIAAAFNTPLAGVVFAIEELSRSFEERTSGTIYTAVIVADVTSVALVGNYTYFGSTQASLTDPRMWVVVPVCGLLGGPGRRRLFALYACASAGSARPTGRVFGLGRRCASPSFAVSSWR